MPLVFLRRITMQIAKLAMQTFLMSTLLMAICNWDIAKRWRFIATMLHWAAPLEYYADTGHKFYCVIGRLKGGKDTESTISDARRTTIDPR